MISRLLNRFHSIIYQYYKERHLSHSSSWYENPIIISLNPIFPNSAFRGRYLGSLKTTYDLENRKTSNGSWWKAGSDVEITWGKKPSSINSPIGNLSTDSWFDPYEWDTYPVQGCQCQAMVDDPIYTYVRPYGKAVYYKSVLFNWSTLKKNEESIKETKEEIYHTMSEKTIKKPKRDAITIRTKPKRDPISNWEKK